MINTETVEPATVDNANTTLDNPNFDEFKRIQTFPLSWPSTNACSKEQLARGGIFFDSGRQGYYCAFCNIQLDPSEMTDVSHHRTLSPNCSIVTNTERRNKTLEPIDNFTLERHRLISFLRTNWTAPVDPYDLAKWGFYWTGTTDTGRCIFCRLEVSCWEPGDAGETEHRRWNSNCPFLNNRQVGNVPLGEEGDMIENMPLQMRITYVNNQQPIPAQELGVMLVKDPLYPQYSTKASRLTTYSLWPRGLSQRPQELVDAGFYYTGKGDRVVCFHCGGGLKDWDQGDQPWVEHAKWFQKCHFLTFVKGHDFVQQVHQVQQERREGGSTEITRDTPSVVALKPQEPQGASSVDDARMCKVCLTNELGIAFLPCGHISTCPDCVPQLKTCPICRSNVNAYVRVYLP